MKIERRQDVGIVNAVSALKAAGETKRLSIKHALMSQTMSFFGDQILAEINRKLNPIISKTHKTFQASVKRNLSKRQRVYSGRKRISLIPGWIMKEQCI